MPKKEDTTLAKIEQNLFRSKDNLVVKMTDKEFEIMQRYQQTFDHWHENPEYIDTQIAAFMEDKFGISRSQAFRDIQAIGRLLGKIKKTSKEWLRYRVTQMAFYDHNLAIAEGQYTSAAILLDKIIKGNKLDQPDSDDIDWDEIKPPNLEPSSDVRVYDPKLYDPDVDRKREILRARYKINKTEYTPFEEIKDGE
jgi:hypothetical protein